MKHSKQQTNLNKGKLKDLAASRFAHLLLAQLGYTEIPDDDRTVAISKAVGYKSKVK